MTSLTLFTEHDPSCPLHHWEEDRDIAAAVHLLGAKFEHLDMLTGIAAPPAETVARLATRYGFENWDVVWVTPETPNQDGLRQTFRREHTHQDAEARLFLAGEGIFHLRTCEAVARLRCGAGDLLHVPAGMRHWFDFPTRPGFRALRLFTRTEGWLARYTGDDIANRFLPAAGVTTH